MRNLRDTVFYMKTNALQDFHIHISVPLTSSWEENFRSRYYDITALLSTYL